MWTLVPLLLAGLLAPRPSVQEAAAPPAASADTRLAEIRKLVAAWDRADSPGGAVAVVRDGKVEVAFAFGAADLAPATPNETTTSFYLASVAKPFTALCAVLASRTGVLQLDGPARQVFPELPEAYRAVTFRHLLQHRSGIPDIYDTAIAADLGSAPIASNAAALKVLAQLDRPCFPAGERFLYSNSGYVLLAEAVARTSKSTLASFARKHVFDRAGMPGTYWLGEAGSRPSAKIYARGEQGWEERAVKTGLTGPGGLFSSVDDLARFEAGWQSGRWPEEDLRRALLTAPEGGENPKLGRYALGWMHQRFGKHRGERHSGGAFGASADFLRFPDDRVTVIVLSNAADLEASQVAVAIAGVVLGEPVEPGPGPTAAVQLSPEEGAAFGRIWLDPATRTLWVVTPKPEGFVIASLGDLKLRLVPEQARRLVAVDAHVPFAVELEGENLVVQGPGGARTRLERVPFPPPAPIRLEDYAGTYAHARLGARIRFEAEPKALRFVQTDPLLSVPPFLPIAPDLFLCDAGAQLRFHRDADGRVDAVIVRANRSAELEFGRE